MSNHYESTESDLVGSFIGDIEILRHVPAHHLCGCPRVRCRCSCGLVFETYLVALLNGTVKGCGCNAQAKPFRRRIAA